MPNNQSIQFLRKSGAPTSDELVKILPGQPLYDTKNNHLYIGQDAKFNTEARLLCYNNNDKDIIKRSFTWANIAQLSRSGELRRNWINTNFRDNINLYTHSLWVSGTNYEAVLLDWSHDPINLDGDIKYASSTWCMNFVYDKKYPMYTDSGFANYGNSYIKNVVLPDIFNQLPLDLQENIVPVYKNWSNSVTQETLWLLALGEIFSESRMEHGSPDSGVNQYLLYKMLEETREPEKHIIKTLSPKMGGDPTSWWLRSNLTERNFYTIRADGYPNYEHSGGNEETSVTTPNSIAFCFCL